ncbi:hypothetical protein TSMEX_008829 [Taenia solium]|eukprot:TsM_000388700 transcript=TsM_000388700 gene=TsM_000388700
MIVSKHISTYKTLECSTQLSMSHTLHFHVCSMSQFALTPCRHQVKWLYTTGDRNTVVLNAMNIAKLFLSAHWNRVVPHFRARFCDWYC